MINTRWDVDKYRCEHESDEHWGLRKQFMETHKNKFPEERLVCLTQVFFNMEFLGCKYPDKTMELVNKLAAEVAQEFREARKGKLKRTFVGAQDAAGAKAKGSKPPPGTTEASVPAPKKLCPDQTSLDYISISEEKGEVANVEDEELPKDVRDTLQKLAKTFVLLIPLRANSKTEEDPMMILNQNYLQKRISFQFHGSKSEGGWTCEAKINPLPNDGEKPKNVIASVYATTQRDGKQAAAAMVLERIKKYCTYIEPDPEWFKDGKTPDFIRDRKQCTKNPRTYIIVTKQETGHITPEVAEMLMKNFETSSNEEMFFPDTEFNEKEKMNLMNRSQTHKSLKFRHFGSKQMLKDHHVCIYKKQTAAQIIKVAKSDQWKHPRFIIKFNNPEMME